MNNKELLRLIQEGSEDNIRQRIFTLGSNSIEHQPLFKHQQESIDAIHDNGELSGIIKLPTAGGKTRIALEYMQQKLNMLKNKKFVWGSYPRDLIKQAMMRLVELGGLFPKGTTFAWFDSDWNLKRDLLDEVDILFITRNQFTKLLEIPVEDGRVKNSVLQRVYDKKQDEDELDMSLIYDECHQLGARKLQMNWAKFTKKFDCNIHTLGFSATPLPTQEEQHYFLQNEIFRLPDDGSVRGEHPEWSMLCHYSLGRNDLIKESVLCPVNDYWQQKDDFDLHVNPGIEAPPADPSKDDINEFVSQFNQNTMESDTILSQLSSNIANNIHILGKTVVFVPTIRAANKLVHKLQDHKEVQGKISLVHSKLDEFSGDGLDRSIANPETQIQAFKEREDEPCVMVNVGMLTTGFDDPNIKSIVLARLTFSDNLFWQMIGRGCRGPKVGGTEFCYVIDPIRLSQKYKVYDGYRPKVSNQESNEYEKIADFKDSEEWLEEQSDKSAVVTVPPPEEDLDKSRFKKYEDNVQRALQEFVDYRTLKDVIQDDKADNDESTKKWCKRMIDNAEDKLDTELDWMRKDTFMPDEFHEAKVHAFHKKVKTCIDNKIKTEDDWNKHLIQQI